MVSFADDVVQDVEQGQKQTLYEILGVDEYVPQDELIKAYRLRALTEHPDKGGDKDHFDELVKAFKVLSVDETRDAYDKDLSKSRDREKIMAPGAKNEKQAQEPMARQKTEPRWGSIRQSKMKQPFHLKFCANEWKGQHTAANFLKMIEDGVTDEQKTEKLLTRFAMLPQGKIKKRQWLEAVRGKDKSDLKDLARKTEADKLAFAQKWLQKGPSGGSRKQSEKAEKLKKEGKTARDLHIFNPKPFKYEEGPEGDTEEKAEEKAEEQPAEVAAAA